MNSKFQPDPNGFDDTEGHGAFSKRVDGPDADDTEGHGAVSKHVDGPDADDTEGHGVKIKI